MFPLLLAVAGFAPAAEPSPNFTAVRASDGEPVTGTVSGIAAGFAVTFSGGTPAVAAGDLVSLARSDKPRPAYPTGPQAILANGDRIAGTVSGGNGLSLTLKAECGNGQAVSIPLTAVAAVWFVPVPADTPADVSRYSWLDAGKKQDVLVLKNGDAVRGRLEAFGTDAATLRFKPDGDASAKPFNTANVAALIFDPTLARVRPPKGPFARVVSADGSRVRVSALISNAETAVGTTLTGAKVTFPLDEIIAVDVRGGKATDLSELKPSAAKEEGFNGVPWPWMANRSVRGNLIRLVTARGEEAFDAGLGVHSKSVLTYSLSGKYKRFEALFGLDAATGKKGAVDVRVLVDGKEVKLDGLIGLTAKVGAKAIRVNVSQAKELTLIVDFGPGGDVQDDVNWANARLVE